MHPVIDSNRTVGDLMAETPRLSRLFETFGIDYCCGGKKTVAQACQEKGLEPTDVLAALQTALTATPDDETPSVTPASSLTALCDHIEGAHHQFLYANLPRLATLADKVARVHGDREPRLRPLRAAFMQLHDELLSHLAKEEQILFPYCRQLDDASVLPAFHCGSVQNPIRAMEQEHDAAGAMLAQIRTLTDNFLPPEWACNTYRAWFDGLRELEGDLHQHIHKENNLLFPKALARFQSLASCQNLA